MCKTGILISHLCQEGISVRFPFPRTGTRRSLSNDIEEKNQGAYENQALWTHFAIFTIWPQAELFCSRLAISSFSTFSATQLDTSPVLLEVFWPENKTSMYILQ